VFGEGARKRDSQDGPSHLDFGYERPLAVSREGVDRIDAIFDLGRGRGHVGANKDFSRDDADTLRRHRANPVQVGCAFYGFLHANTNRFLDLRRRGTSIFDDDLNRFGVDRGKFFLC
jgi:hypothetical protein